MRWFARIKAWFKREKAPIPGPEPGPIVRSIFRRVIHGAKITEQIHIR